MPTFRKIAVAIDFGVPSIHAARAARAMATKHSAELTLLHVVAPIVVPYPIALIPDPAMLEAAAKRELDDLAEREEVARAHRVVLRGSPAAEIAAFVEANRIDLVVSGTHGRKALARWMLGSVAEKILRSSHVPVLVVHDRPRPLRRILAATDFGSTSARALEIAADVAATHAASLTLLHVRTELWPPFPVTGVAAPPYPVIVGPSPAELEDAARKTLDEVSRNLRLLAPGHESLLRRGSAWAEIVGEAGEGSYDLVVVGTHGRTGPARWLLGSVAERVVRASPAPVLVVPALDVELPRSRSAQGTRADRPARSS